MMFGCIRLQPRSLTNCSVNMAVVSDIYLGHWSKRKPMKSTQKMYNLMRSTLISSEDRAYWLLQLMLVELGFDWQARRSLPKMILDIIQAETDEPTAAMKVWALLGTQAHVVGNKLIGRADLITSQVEPYLTGERLLDFGCGDGQVGQKLSNRFKVVAHDVADYRLIKSNPFTFDWGNLGCQQFDSAMAVAVFHHCDEPDIEIERLAGVTQRLVVIESVIDSTMPWEIQALVDWIYNRGMHPGASIPVPGNFRTIEGWAETFSRLGFEVTHTEDFGIDLPIVPEHHVLFVLDRKI